MAESTYDLVVIGAGPGGYQAAIRASQLGMRVACVEKDATLGGTCLNVGCIPSKALLESTHRFRVVGHELAAHGIRVENASFDLAAMMERKTGIVDGLTKGIDGLFKKHKIARLTGTATILGAGKVKVSGGDSATIGAGRILVATGSVAAELPNLPFDGKRILSSTEALTLTEVPRRMIVVGAGAIGLEMGSVWARLGTEVVVVELTDQVVPGADKEAARALQKALTAQGIEFRLETTVEAAKTSDGGVAVTLSGKGAEEDRADLVLVAVGRRAFTGSLGAKEAGIETDERGRIRVEGHYATSLGGVFAVGDVIAGPMLAHKAEEEGVAAVERMAGVAGHVNYDAIPSVVYTHPELASVGLSEEAAKKDGRKIRTGKFPFKANARARCNGDTDGFAKIVADAETDTVLGIHIVGAGASELIAEAAVAMEYVATSEDIARTVHAHPTLAEALKEAALAVDGRTITI